jgi:hypothetical protein
LFVEECFNPTPDKSGGKTQKKSSRQSIISLEEHFEFLETKFTTLSMKVGLGLARYFLYHFKL